MQMLSRESDWSHTCTWTPLSSVRIAASTSSSILSTVADNDAISSSFFATNIGSPATCTAPSAPPMRMAGIQPMRMEGCTHGFVEVACGNLDTLGANDILVCFVSVLDSNILHSLGQEERADGGHYCSFKTTQHNRVVLQHAIV